MAPAGVARPVGRTGDSVWSRAVDLRHLDTGTMGLRPILACAALVLGFGAVPALTGAPMANADAVDCIDYLYWKHFDGFIISACVRAGSARTATCGAAKTSSPGRTCDRRTSSRKRAGRRPSPRASAGAPG
ncbi:hypothetical protein GCM10027184_70520 [Saccharothrix stipae]